MFHSPNWQRLAMASKLALPAIALAAALALPSPAAAKTITAVMHADLRDSRHDDDGLYRARLRLHGL